MSETVAIVDYGAGNLRSASNALMRVAGAMRSGPHILVTADPEAVAGADRVVLPGVGAFGDCMAGIEAIPGMRDALVEFVTRLGRPFLGICVGMQLMAAVGREHGEHRGFGWIGGAVESLGCRPGPDGRALKVPHMGWNVLEIRRPTHPVLANLPASPHVYFVHSYQLVADEPSAVLATTDYGGPVTATVGRDAMVGTQFHPEKSQAVGLAILRNFLEWRPR